MDPRTPPTTPAARSPDNRPEIHNSDVDEQVAETGACGQVHLPTGRTCVLEHRHQGACEFVPREEVQDSVAQHRAADDW